MTYDLTSVVIRPLLLTSDSIIYDRGILWCTSFDVNVKMTGMGIIEKDPQFFSFLRGIR